jgi:hypothetical protein
MKEDLLKRFAVEGAAYNTLKQQAESAVIRWRYSRSELWDFDPTRQDVMSTKEVATADEATFAYGYDDRNRVVCIRHYSVRTELNQELWASTGKLEHIRKKELGIEYFLQYQDNTIQISRFLLTRFLFRDNSPIVQYVYQARTDGHRIVELETLDDRTYDHMKYLYEGDFLKTEQTFDEHGRLTFECINEKDGTHVLYKIGRDGSRRDLNAPRPKGLTLKALTETVRKRLLEAIPQTIKSAGIKEPVYCIALAYDGEGNDVLLPCIGIGLESERKQWLEAHGRDAWQFIWNPAEFYNYERDHTQLDDDELSQAADHLNELLSDRPSTAPAQKLVIEVAAELNKLDWSNFIQTTPDFIVYAVDFELSQLKKNLKKILPSEKLTTLKSTKLI